MADDQGGLKLIRRARELRAELKGGNGLGAGEASVRRPEEARSAGRHEPEVEGPISFSELVWAHWLWERPLHDDKGDDPLNDDKRNDPVLEANYRRKLRKFEAQEGKVEVVYWSTIDASAVALTVKRRRWRDPVVRFHRATDWVTKHAPKIADLLFSCESLAIRVSEILRGSSELIAMQRLASVASYLLGFIDRSGVSPTDEEMKVVETAQRKELARIENYYQRAGNHAGRLVYFWGMLLGLVALAGVVALGVLALTWGGYVAPSTPEVSTFIACLVAGSVGAIVSVMSRMAPPQRGRSNRFSVDYELGRVPIRLLGAFRPLLGGVFGVAVYFALQSGLLRVEIGPDEQSFYFFAVVAFLSGFSERLAHVIIGGAEQSLEASTKSPNSPARKDQTKREQRSDEGE